MDMEATRQRWESMNAEILGMIFLRISRRVDKRVKTLCLVCKWWFEVVVGPYCLAEINLVRWCRKTSHLEVVDSVVQKLICSSKSSVRSLSTFVIGDVGLDCVATCGRFLTVLQIPICNITDDMVEKHVGSFVNLKELDISLCVKLTGKGISYFGKSCPSLSSLRRNMIPNFGGSKIVEDEAYAVANTMRGLRRLELANGCFGDCGLNEILTSCKSLTQLCIEGCDRVSLVGDLKERCEHLLVPKTAFGGFSIEECTESGSNGSDDDDDDDDGDDDDDDDEES